MEEIEIDRIIEENEVPNIDKNNLINNVIHGDCINVMKNIPEDFVHLIITSPPYNVGIPYDNHNDLMPYNEYLQFLENTWRECYRVLAKGGRICINVPSVTADGEYQPLFVDVVS